MEPMEPKIGDIVKSLDFNGINDCYMVGKVVGVYRASGIFRAKFISRIWEGTEDKEFKTDYFMAPLQGSLLGDNPSSPRVLVVS